MTGLEILYLVIYLVVAIVVIIGSYIESEVEKSSMDPSAVVCIAILWPPIAAFALGIGAIWGFFWCIDYGLRSIARFCIWSYKTIKKQPSKELL